MTLRTLLLAGLLAGLITAAPSAQAARRNTAAAPAAAVLPTPENEEGWLEPEPLGRASCHAPDCAAQAAQEAGDFSGAATQYDRLAQGPADAEARAGYAARAAQAWLEDDRPQQARLSALAGLALAPDDDTLHLRRAEADGATGHADEAMADLDRVLAHRPAFVEARVARAIAYRHRDMIAEARADIDAALAARPDDPEALLERGVLDQRAGDGEHARTAWQHVIEVAPDGRAADHAREDLALLDAGPADQ